MSLIEFRGVNKFFGDFQVLKDIDFSVDEGEVVVTHEMGFARRVANRVVFMDEGRIVEVGTPEHFFQNPENDPPSAFDQILHM
jgi:ABC-type polar amino acid transport system ATPase subunit